MHQSDSCGYQNDVWSPPANDGYLNLTSLYPVPAAQLLEALDSDTRLHEANTDRMRNTGSVAIALRNLDKRRVSRTYSTPFRRNAYTASGPQQLGATRILGNISLPFLPCVFLQMRLAVALQFRGKPTLHASSTLCSWEYDCTHSTREEHK